SGYLDGASSASDLPMIIDVPVGFVGIANTDASGTVTSVDVLDGGGGFNAVPTLVFADDVTWDSAPTLTAVLSTAVYGAQIAASYNNEFRRCHFEGWRRGLWLSSTCQSNVLDEVAGRSGFTDDPIYIESHTGTFGSGIKRIFGTNGVPLA